MAVIHRHAMSARLSAVLCVPVCCVAVDIRYAPECFIDPDYPRVNIDSSL